MAGQPRKLDKAQTLALQEVTTKFRAQRDGKLLAEIRIREQVEKELALLNADLALAVRRAFELGVPKSKIGQLGLSTTARITVEKWLSLTEQGPRVLSVPLFRWEDAASGAVRVQIADFKTEVTAKEDYPAVLEGVARRVDGAWEVVDDPGTVSTATGDLPGWFTWEIESGKKLPAMLDAWIEQQ